MPSVPRSADNDDPADVLAIGCFAAICRDRLADALVAFTTRHPAVGVGVHEMPRTALLSALRSRELSVVILPGDPDPAFASAPLWEDEVVAVVPAADPIATTPCVNGAALAGRVMLVSRQHGGSDMHRFLAARVLPPNAFPPVVIVDLPTAPLLERVARGDGVTLLCRSYAPEVPGVALRPVIGSAALFPVHALWRGGEDPSAALAALLRSIRGRDAQTG